MDRLHALLEAGRPLTAWESAKTYAPLHQWPAGKARNIAARLAGALGNGRLRRVLHRLNTRQFPDDPDFFLRALFEEWRLGPLRVYEKLERHLQCATTPFTPEHLGECYALMGRLFGQFRDFERAHEAIQRALDADPDDYWVRVQQAAVLEQEDRYAEALEAAQLGLKMGPGRIPAVTQMADLLVHLGRDEEAMTLLQQHHEASEAAAFAGYLVHFYSEREDHERALFYLNAHDARAPLADKQILEWSRRRRADFLYLAGEIDAMLASCDQLPPGGYHQRVAANLREPEARERQRKRLDVPFVRQHNMTCAPATLAALAAFWGKEFDHLAISDAICHHGTPGFKERLWAQENGFDAPEFRLTREVLIELIDRGVPFTLTTEALASAHLQACIGYDDRQGIALLRDPTERHFGEILLSGLIEDHPVQGPRAMLLLPVEERWRIDGITLPDRTLYDARHQLSLALEAHDRVRARAIVEAMPRDAPLTLEARYLLAYYDNNLPAQLDAIEALVTRFPENTNLRHTRLTIVGRMEHFAQQRELLHAELARKKCDPLFYAEMGELLLNDARHLPMADYYLRKAVRLRWATGQGYASLAYCRWKERRFEESARYRRIASCLNPGWESYAAAYAEVCRMIRRSAEGVAFLRARVDQQGKKSGAPWLTLAHELEAQGRTPEAIAVLEEALEARPDDGSLHLEGGRKLVLWGRQEQGKALMVAARGKVRDGEWHEEMARMSGFLGHRQEEIAHWRAHLEIEPLALPAYRSLARLLADEGGVGEADRFLSEATARHPQWADLWSLKAEWDAVLHGPGAALRSLEKAYALNPEAAEIVREMAQHAGNAGESDRAIALAREALSLAPKFAIGHRVLGNLLEKQRLFDQAREAYRSAIALDIDDTPSCRALLRLAPDPEAKRAELRWLATQMQAQVSNGRIVPEYRELAYRYLDPQELLSELRGFCHERPDLWQTWAALAQQASAMENPDEALKLAITLTERFPLTPDAWAERATVHRLAGDHEAEAAALREALALAPSWDWASRQLADALEHLGRYEEALEVLQRAVRHEPLVGPNHGFLADLLWRLGRREEAWQQLMTGMRDSPEYSWGWETLAEWAPELKHEEELLTHLRSHDARRRHLPDWWESVSDVCRALDRDEEGLQALATGLEIHPDHPLLLNQKAYQLTFLHRYEEALELCARAVGLHPQERQLQTRQAWVLMHAGQPNEAIRCMQSVLEQHPEDLEATAQLADWLSDRERWKELHPLARRWVRLAPGNARAYGFLGEAARGLEQSAEARQAFEKAFQLRPDYLYAGGALLSLQIAEGAFDAAEQTLEKLAHFSPGATTAANAVELAIGRRDPQAARAAAATLLAHPEADRQLLNWVSSLFSKALWQKEWWSVLDVAAANATPSAAVLAIWVATLPSRGKIGTAVRRLNRLKDDDLRALGWITLLEAGEAIPRWRRRWWLLRHRRWFHSRNDLWNCVGEILVGEARYRRACRWLADWPTRQPSAPVSAIFNYGSALESLKGWKAAATLRRETLDAHPAGHYGMLLRVLVALHRGLEGERLASQRLAGEVEPGELNTYYTACFDLCQSLEHAAQGEETKARMAYERAMAVFNACAWDRGNESIVQSSGERLAQLLPWAEGRRRKLQREWGKYRPADRRGWSRQVWLLLLLLWLLFRAFFRDS